MISVNGTAIAAGLGVLAFATLAFSAQPGSEPATEKQPRITASAVCEESVWPYIPPECLRDERQVSESGIRLAGS